MFLHIENDTHLQLKDFCQWLKIQIHDYAVSETNWDQVKVAAWNEFFKDTNLGWPVDENGNPVSPTFTYIVNVYFSNLRVDELEGDDYLITVDPNIKLFGSDVTIDTLAQIINYGTLTNSAYPYFDKVFQYFADNLHQLYYSYGG